jgi:hypothetical protein
VLESVSSARGFWARQGYRCLQGVSYQQPPLRFDEHTGAALQEAIPLMLIVKPIDEAEAIAAGLLEAAVRAVYASWYLSTPGEHTEAVAATISSSIFDGPFAVFQRSRQVQSLADRPCRANHDTVCGRRSCPAGRASGCWRPARAPRSQVAWRLLPRYADLVG